MDPNKEAAIAAQQERIARLGPPRYTPQQRMTKLDSLLAIPKWHQSIDCGAGLRTAGMWQQPHIEQPLLACGLAGKRVLEVGTLEGGWAFLAEDHVAAEVHTIDIFDRGGGPDGFQQRFWAMHEYRESRVQYHTLNVYDLNESVGEFDVINFTGVYYHLRHPLLAFERLWPRLRPDGVMLVEGQYATGDDALAYLWHGQVLENDRTNWWTPTKQCLREWFDATGFRCEELSGHETSVYRVTKGDRRLEIGRAVYYLRRK